MKHFTKALLHISMIILSTHLSGCIKVSDSDTTPPNNDSNTIDTSLGTLSVCQYPLVRLQTSQDNTCSGGNEHHWPVGMATNDCHGWRGTDPSGGVHDNSANDIRCNTDSSFQFTQFAGNLACNGTGVTKVYTLNECEQDIPPVLYTMAIDLTCCSDPDSAGCVTGTPSVSVAKGEVTLNGELCE